MISRNPTRSLFLLTAWLLYACGNAPTAPAGAGEAPGPATRADPAAEREAPAPSDGRALADERALADPLGLWALDPGATATDHDARIARAILDLTDERKEILP